MSLLRKIAAIAILTSAAATAAEDFDLPELPEAKATATEPKTTEADSYEIDDSAKVDFAPIVSSSISATVQDSGKGGASPLSASTLGAPASGVAASIQIVPRKTPASLERNVKVGVHIGVKTLYALQGNEEIQITASGNKVKLQGGKTSRTVSTWEIPSKGKCTALANSKGALKKKCYPGKFTISANKGLLNAVNEVSVEEYLRGVVPYEIGTLDSNRFSALQSQAIAARTYAYKHFGSRESAGFDIYADTRDQVYNGLSSATALTDSAVKSTEGIVMTYDGEFIIAYYHSTCGGETETPATWGKPERPYLKTSPDLRPDGTPWCSESKYVSWEQKFTDSEVDSLFRKNAAEAKAKANAFKKVSAIAITDTLASGRILTLEVTTDKGNFTVKGDMVRWLFKRAGTILPSSFFKVAHENGEWTITGKGFGHGVGMCQMGVRGRAAAGQSFLEILTHYYPGISLERFVK